MTLHHLHGVPWTENRIYLQQYLITSVVYENHYTNVPTPLGFEAKTVSENILSLRERNVT